jgi:hypothetical protein
MNNRTRKSTRPINPAASNALDAFRAALYARPASEAAIAAALATLAEVIQREAASGATATGFVQAVGVNKRGEAVTDGGFPVGTPFAYVAYTCGGRLERGTVYPCGTIDCGFHPGFTA